MQVLAAFLSALLLLGRDPVGLSPRIPANPGHLPADLDPALVRTDRESVALDLAGHDGLSEVSDHSQLIAEIAVEVLEIRRQPDMRRAVFVGGHIAAVYVEHVRRFDERVRKILIFRVFGVIDSETTASLAQLAGDPDLADE